MIKYVLAIIVSFALVGCSLELEKPVTSGAKENAEEAKAVPVDITQEGSFVRLQMGSWSSGGIICVGGYKFVVLRVHSSVAISQILDDQDKGIRCGVEKSPKEGHDRTLSTTALEDVAELGPNDNAQF